MYNVEQGTAAAHGGGAGANEPKPELAQAVGGVFRLPACFVCVCMCELVSVQNKTGEYIMMLVETNMATSELSQWCQCSWMGQRSEEI